jgi:hypothetical protein
VLRPLRALEPGPGTLRLRLVLAGRGHAGHRPAVRLRQRARAALPPGDRRPGRGHPGRAVPRALLGRAGQRGGAQRAHHRDRLARQAGPQRPPAGVRRGHPGAVRRRDRQPPWPGHRRPGQAVVAAGGAASADRRRGQPGDRRLGGRLGRRPDHRQPARRAAAPGGRRLPGRRRGQADVPPGPPGLCAGRGHGAGQRPPAVGRMRARRLAGLGAGAARAVRGGGQARAARRRPRDGAGLGRPVAPDRVDVFCAHGFAQPQRPTIELFAAEVLPALAASAAAAPTGRAGR